MSCVVCSSLMKMVCSSSFEAVGTVEGFKAKMYRKCLLGRTSQSVTIPDTSCTIEWEGP